MNGKDHDKRIPAERLEDTMLGLIGEVRQNLEGKFLTVIDAVTTDNKQREALKSLVRNAVWAGHLNDAYSEDTIAMVNQFVGKYTNLETSERYKKMKDNPTTRGYFRD